jgi:hypothetical protein
LLDGDYGAEVPFVLLVGLGVDELAAVLFLLIELCEERGSL